MGSRDRFITPAKRPIVESILADSAKTLRRIEILTQNKVIGPTRSKNFISAARKIAGNRLRGKDEDADALESALLESLSGFENAVGTPPLSRLIRTEGSE
jgi:hypothetical protein